MAIIKYKWPPQTDTGDSTFSDDLVGVQLVAGGGLTNANFNFTTGITEKQNRTFNIGAFSDPISLSDLDLKSIEESKVLIAKNLQVYPNFDLSEITNFTLFGSLTKRISTSITRIINYFPASVECLTNNLNFQTGLTAVNISFNKILNETYLEIPLNWIRNPFDIDFTTNATRNFELSEVEQSPLRNLTVQYKNYSIFVNNSEYNVVFLDPTDETDNYLKLYVNGNPFSGMSATTDSIILRPNTNYTEKSFNDFFDEVEKFLLNRLIQPIYTATFQVPQENNDGTYTTTSQNITWPLDGLWNLDIRTNDFDKYLTTLNDLCEDLDSYNTNLISRFLTTGALKEFDTGDRKLEKVLQIYGRSFDEVRKFVMSLANMTSVNYNTGNDIPSQLLKNLAETLGWKTNISPISNESLLDSIFGTNQESNFPGYSRALTPDEINYQFYKNLILNAAYLFKSKGTRRSIEILLRLIGAPEALIDFNEYIYIADERINLSQFENQYLNISGGLYVQQLPVSDPTDTFSIMGVLYSGFTLQTTISGVTTTRLDYPMDSLGYPTAAQESEGYFFQIGGGWYESTPDHHMPEQVVETNQVFVGQNPNYQTVLLPFNYGQTYLDRYRKFPFMSLGYDLVKVIDNKKSWTIDNVGLRNTSDGGFTAYYRVYDERFVVNVKNVDVFLNPAQGLVYDVWSMSRQYNYPIPNEGLDYVEPTYCNPNPNGPYPNRGGIDWTEINPKPKQKTFFEFAQTFWHNMINVRNRQFITDGKTGGYPTLQSIYWKYLESEQAINIPNDNFTYKTMIDYVNGIGDYWIKLVGQMIPATTLVTSGVRLENSIFHRQKFVWRRQMGCQIVPIPCKPCALVGQLFAVDCPIQKVTCPIYPWGSNPTVTSFAVVLNSLLQSQGYILPGCDLNSLESTWYIDLVLNGNTLVHDEFFTGYGNTSPIASYPSQNDWITALESSLSNLQSEGLNYVINTNDTVTVYNGNCIPLSVTQDFKINVGINFNLLCNQ